MLNYTNQVMATVMENLEVLENLKCVISRHGIVIEILEVTEISKYLGTQKINSPIEMSSDFGMFLTFVH